VDINGDCITYVFVYWLRAAIALKRNETINMIEGRYKW
jgi:hypothetical protein